MHNPFETGDFAGALARAGVGMQQTQAQADYLRAQHCPSAQGFLFGMPMTAAAVADRLTPAAPPRE